MMNMFGGGSPSYVATMPMAPAGYANGNNNNDNGCGLFPCSVVGVIGAMAWAVSVA